MNDRSYHITLVFVRFYSRIMFQRVNFYIDVISISQNREKVVR